MDSVLEIDGEAFKEGQLLLLDKPLEWTSFQAVNALKWYIKKKFGFKKIKVGHAGTLDPLASGLLLVCTGKFTKRIPELQGQTKEYTGSFTLGATTPSYDLETAVDAEFPIDHISEAMIQEATQSFLGAVQQVPPVYSALKKDGKPLYEYARAGKAVEVKTRTVQVDVFEITKIEMPKVYFRVVCGKGTYIRSLAHDYGKTLGSGAHLSALRRTKIGDYHVDKGVSPEIFKNRT